LKRKLKLRFVSTDIPEEKEYKATLPESPDAGATISFVIDASTPNYDPNVPGETKIYPTDDAYERDGSYGSTAFGMTDPHILVVKQDNADGYRRQASLKFDLSDLDASEIEEAELTLYVGRANANITATAWQLYYIANDNWSENTVTWNNKPPYSTLLGTFPGSPAGTKVTYNLTQAVITELASDKKLSMQIVSTERADGRTDADFISKDSPETDLLPHLLITNRRTGRSVVQPEPEIGMTIPGNPIRRGEEAVLHYRTPAAAVITVTVSDLSGRTVSESTISAVAGENRLPLKTSNLPAGLYLIRLTDRYNAQSGSVKLGIRN
jgi:hypothetical protein